MHTSKPEAIIYIPGRFSSDGDKDLESFSYRIKKAIDINHSESGYKFGLELSKRTFGRDNRLDCKVGSIYRLEGQNKIPVYDIYELDYNLELKEKFEKQNVLIKTLILFNAIISKFPRLLYVFARVPGISLRDKMQVFIVGIILLCLSAYGLSLISAMIAAVGSKFSIGNFPNPLNYIQISGFGDSKFAKLVWTHIYNFFHPLFGFFYDLGASAVRLLNAYKKYILSSAAAVLLLLPGLKNAITNIATDFLCLINYFNIGERRMSIIGKFEELLEHVTEDPRAYSKVSVYSFSFGTIVALDALFPYDGKTSERIKTRIHTLVTIGCPYDFIRVYWPYYFQNRKNPDLLLSKWYNIYSSVDVLSSNFRNDAGLKEATIHIADKSILPVNIPFNVIAPEGVSFSDMVMLLGLRAHSRYWDESEYSASCFTNLFQEMKKEFIKEQIVNNNAGPEAENITKDQEQLSQAASGNNAEKV